MSRQKHSHKIVYWETTIRNTNSFDCKFLKLSCTVAFLTCKHPSQSCHDPTCPPDVQGWQQEDDNRGQDHAFVGQHQLRRRRRQDVREIYTQTKTQNIFLLFFKLR